MLASSGSSYGNRFLFFQTIVASAVPVRFLAAPGKVSATCFRHSNDRSNRHAGSAALATRVGPEQHRNNQFRIETRSRKSVNMRVPPPIASRPPPPFDPVRRAGTSKPIAPFYIGALIALPRAAPTRCGVRRCGAQLTGRQMRARFTLCPKRPAASEHGHCEDGPRKRSAGTRRARVCYAAGAMERGTTGDLALARRRVCASCGCACVPGQI